MGKQATGVMAGGLTLRQVALWSLGLPLDKPEPPPFPVPTMAQLAAWRVLADKDLAKYQQWATETGNPYRCARHSEPNPFCGCVDVLGRLFLEDHGFRVEMLDGQQEVRAVAVQTARRQYHSWVDRQRPVRVEAVRQWRGLLSERKAAIKGYREWRLRWAAAGFEAVGIYQQRRQQHGVDSEGVSEQDGQAGDAQGS